MAKATNANKAGTTTTRPAYNRPLGRAAAKQTPEIIAVSEEHRPFRRINFIQMGICAGLILIGFLLMLGGGSNTCDKRLMTDLGENTPQSYYV